MNDGNEKKSRIKYDILINHKRNNLALIIIIKMYVQMISAMRIKLFIYLYICVFFHSKLISGLKKIDTS